MLKTTEELEMPDSTIEIQGLNETSTISIDYRHYDERARNLRSEAAWEFLHGLFSEKKSSSVNRLSLSDWMEATLSGIRCRLRPCPQV